MKRHHFIVLAFLIIGIPTLLFAHGNAKHVMGTVTETAQDHIVVKTTKGKLVTVSISSDTIFQRNGITLDGVRPEVGNRVIAETVKEGDRLVAKELRFSSGKRK